jgi:uncharacterized membrane protein
MTTFLTGDTLYMTQADKENDALWKWGVFYYNPNDPAVTVDKRKGYGITFNYAHRVAYFYTALPLVIPTALGIFIYYTILR